MGFMIGAFVHINYVLIANSMFMKFKILSYER